MRAKPEPQHSPQFRGLQPRAEPRRFSRNVSPAPPPSLPHRDHRHFFGAAAILTRLGEYGGAHQALKDGLPSKHKHFAVLRRRFASKAHVRESLFAAARRTTPGSSLVQQDNAQATRPHVTANNSSHTHTHTPSLLTRSPHCNRKFPLQCLYLHLLLLPFSSAGLGAA